jgi:2-dehydro-3-deoxygalactonokinase
MVIARLPAGCTIGILPSPPVAGKPSAAGPLSPNHVGDAIEVVIEQDCRDDDDEDRGAQIPHNRDPNAATAPSAVTAVTTGALAAAHDEGIVTGDTRLIGLDWGITTLRAFRIGAGGVVLDRRSSDQGILNVAHGAFEEVFERAVGDWLDAAPDAPVLASGMITSRQGWVEPPYIACPAGCDELARALHLERTRRGRAVRFVTGLTVAGSGGVPDVMRGEETEIVGALAEEAMLLVLPGTHSKWALAEAGRVVWFATFMTGEVFAVLKDHSILGRLIEGEADDRAARERGLAYGLLDDARAGGLLKRLFSARTLGLFDEIPPTGVASYLSGLLIGAEIREAVACARARVAVDAVTVLGATALSDLYVAALARAGLAAERGPHDAAARGHWRIARAAGLVG